MRVRRIGQCILLVWSLCACNGKTLDSVFGSTNNNQLNASSCSTQSLSTMATQFIVHWEDGHVSTEQSENIEMLKAKFVAPHLAAIHHVEPDQVVAVRGPLVGQRVAASAVATNLNTWGPDTIQASAAWAQGSSGQGVLVGIVDAAVDYTQPQLAGQLAPNLAEINGKTGIDDDGNGFVDDFYGWDFVGNGNNPSALVSPHNEHGTHVSGIVAADGSKGPIQGVAPQAKIIPVNFMDATGSGNLSKAIQALQYAASRGAKVINASWGGSQCSTTLQSVMAALAQQNVTVVVAAGNSGLNLDNSPDYPASYNFATQLNVASSNQSDFLDTWSNFSFNVVHLAAPGDTILSTVPGGQAFMSGTSMAAPFVTGTAALLLSARPAATALEIRQALLAGTDNLGLATTSRGRLNVPNALSSLKALRP